jgi:membrane-associated phospholipid phosphatase
VDQWVASWVAEHRSAVATTLATGVMDAGTGALVPAILLLVFAFYVIRCHAYAFAVSVASSTIGALVLSLWLKAVIGRPRPPVALALVHAPGFSMPSTDATLMSALTLSLAAHFLPGWTQRQRRTAWALAAVVNLAVAACLVYLGAHWVSDVPAGWATGAAVVLLVLLLLRRLPTAREIS